MKKYEAEFKLEVVQSVSAGEVGVKISARRWSVPEQKVRKWVSHYRLHGVEGLRPKRSTYGAQFKLQVLSHRDRVQRSNRQVAAIYDIRPPERWTMCRDDWFNPPAQSVGDAGFAQATIKSARADPQPFSEGLARNSTVRR
jgi:transposase